MASNVVGYFKPDEVQRELVQGLRPGRFRDQLRGGRLSYIGEWSGGSPFEVSDEEVRERLRAMGRVPETDEEYLSGCVRFGKGTRKDTHLRNRNRAGTWIDTWHALDASLEAFG